MMASIRRIKTLTTRNIKEIIRDPLGPVFLIAVPLFMEVLFYLAFHSLTSQFAMSLLAPGIVVFSEAFLTLFAGLLISVDRNTSFLTRLYVSNASAHEFILSYFFSLLPIAFVQSVLFLAVGGLLDPTFWSPYLLIGVLFSIITTALFLSFGVLFGSICNEKSIGGVSSIVIVSQSLLSGMWFPTEGLPQGFLVFMRVLPFKNATLLLQNGIAGVFSFEDTVMPLLIVLAYTAVVFVLAVLIFRKKMEEN